MNGRPSPARRALSACAPARSFLRIAVAAAALSSTGCATIATVQSSTPKSARVFSGTGLDLRAALGAPIPSRLYKVDPPPYPWLDLPFSFALDVLILPMTLGIGGVHN